MDNRRMLSVRGLLVANATGLLLLVGLVRAASASTSFVPSIGLSGSWTNNIDMAPAGQKQIGEFLDAEPGFDFTHDSTLEHAAVDYTLHGLFFSDGQHEFVHTGDIASQTHVLPNWFELDIAGQRTQGPANAALPTSTYYLFPLANLADFTSGMVEPIFLHTFKAMKVEASYTRGISSDEELGVPDAAKYIGNEQNGMFTASSPDVSSRVTWSGTYQRQQETYESPYSENYLFEQAGGQVGVLTMSSIRLIAEGGKESNPELNVSAGGFGSEYYSGGFDWSNGPFNELKLLVGRQFFGRSYEALWRRQSRLLNLQVSYSEQPTTQDQSMLQQPLAAAPVAPVPGVPAFTQLSQEIFVNKALTGSITITGRLTEIGLSITDSKQTYLTLGAVAPTLAGLGEQDSERSVTVYLSRRLGATMDVNISGTVSKIGLLDAAATEYTQQQYSATLTRHLGKQSSLYLQAEHLRELGETSSSVEVDVVTIGFKMSFGKAPPSSNSRIAMTDEQ